MVSPDSRTMLTAALKPPPNMAFDAAVATSYTLDPALALMMPVLFSQGTSYRNATEEDNAILRLQRLRNHADSITIFVQEGGIKVPRMLKPSPAYSLLEPMIYEMKSPKGGIFHPKMVLVRYKDGDGYKQMRLVVMTRNLTFDKSWDVAVILDGEVDPGKRSSKNDVLAKFIHSLSSTEGLSEKRRAVINSLRTDLAHVRFLPPEGYSQYDFHAPHIDGIDWIPNQEIEEWGIISPFLTKGAMDALGEGLTEPSFVLSRDEELTKVGDIPNGMVLRDVEELSDDDDAVEPIQVSGLHAKSYMYDYTYMNLPFTRLVVGSGNATSAALVNSSPRNVEFMVSLSGKRIKNGVKDFAKAMEPYWMPFDPENMSETDEERAAVQQKLEECKKRLLEIGFRVDCEQSDDGLVEMFLRTQFGRKVDEFDGVRNISAFPVTQSSLMAKVLDVPGKSWTLGKVRPESVTGLVAFEIRSDKFDLKESFVLNLQVRGMPSERDDQILASLISNRSAFLRFLAMLLEDGSSAVVRGGGAPDSSIMALLRSSGFGDMPIADSLLRAYCRSPKVLKEIARAISAADKACSDAVPEDFRELWAGFAPLAGDLR